MTDVLIKGTINSSLKRLVRTLGFADTEARKIRASLSKIQRYIKSLVSESEFDQLSVPQFEEIKEEIIRYSETTLKETLGKIADDVLNLAKREVLFNIEFLNQNFSDIAKPKALTSSLKNSQIDGISYTDTYKNFIDSSTDAYSKLITNSYYNGTKGDVFFSELKNLQGILKTRTTTLSRTLTNHSSNLAKSEVFQANKDIIKKVQFVATLDGRTTHECASLDGTVYDINERYPKPPLHYNCRSTIVPLVDEDLLPKELSATGTRASAEGYVPASLNYSDWFDQQSKSFQKKYLGDKNFDLYQKGKFKIKDFKGTNEIVTLESL